MWGVFRVACVLVLVGCGGSLKDKDAGGDAQIAVEGGVDLAANDGSDRGRDAVADSSGAGDIVGGAIACGRTLTCAGTDVCMTWECGGGPPPQCIDPLDGGQCPAGTAPDLRCRGANGGCVQECSPSYACVPWPTACGVALNCNCAATVCSGMGSCLITGDRTVACGAV